MPVEPGRRLRREALDPKGTVVMGAGIAPGMTNLIAADLLSRHPEADGVEIVFTISTKASGGPAAAEFAHHAATARRYHGTAVVPLPEPFGRRRCFGFAEAEGGWLGDVATGRSVSPYVCIAEPAAHRAMLALNATGLLSRLPRGAFRPSKVENGAPTTEPVAHWVAVQEGGRRIAASTLECEGDFVTAGRCTRALAEALLDEDRGADGRGVFCPEDLVTIGRIMPRLDAAGVRVVDRAPDGAARLDEAVAVAS
jgi:hypothetical protein